MSLLLFLLLIICCIYFRASLYAWLDQLKGYILATISGPSVPAIYRYDKHSLYANWVFLHADDATIMDLSWQEREVFVSGVSPTTSLV